MAIVDNGSSAPASGSQLWVDPVKPWSRTSGGPAPTRIAWSRRPSLRRISWLCGEAWDTDQDGSGSDLWQHQGQNQKAKPKARKRIERIGRIERISSTANRNKSKHRVQCDATPSLLGTIR